MVISYARLIISTLQGQIFSQSSQLKRSWWVKYFLTSTKYGNLSKKGLIMICICLDLDMDIMIRVSSKTVKSPLKAHTKETVCQLRDHTAASDIV